MKLTPEKSKTFSFFHSWLIWACAAFFYCYEFMLRVSPGVMTNDLMRDFHVGGYALGILAGLYYDTYATLQIPGGVLMDYFKPRRVITIAALITASGCLLFSSAESLPTACIGRALIGIGSATGLLGCIKLGTLWFPTHKLPFIVGMSFFLGTMGGAMAGFPLAHLIEHVGGWRHAMGLLSFIGFFASFLAFCFIRDKPPAALEKAILESHGDKERHLPPTKIFVSIRKVMRNPQSWLIALYGFLSYVPLASFTDLWGTPFFAAVYHLDTATAAMVNSSLYIGFGVTAPFFPLLCKIFKAYRPVIFLSAIVPMFFFAAIVYFPVYPPWLLMGLLFVSGAFLSGQCIAFAMTCALNPLSASGTAAGFHNMVCMLSGVTISPLIGWILDHTWKGGWRDKVHLFTHFEYSCALSSVVFSLFLACCIVFFIEERYTSGGNLPVQ